LIGLAELVDKKIEPQSLIDAWLAELKALLGIHWQTGGLSASQMHRAAVLEVGKYASPTWTENRGRFGNL
jgi:lipoate-protein ligase A